MVIKSTRIIQVDYAKLEPLIKYFVNENSELTSADKSLKKIVCETLMTIQFILDKFKINFSRFNRFISY